MPKMPDQRMHDLCDREQMEMSEMQSRFIIEKGAYPLKLNRNNVKDFVGVH